jgi:hypothetical protein
VDSKALIMVFVCIIVAFYLHLEWLVAFLVVFLFLVALGSVGGEKKKAPAQKGPEEVIYPVIYEDVGESPWLYHPNTKIEVNPEWRPASQWGSAASGMAAIFRAIGNLLRGKEE